MNENLPTESSSFDPRGFERPDPALLTYYTWVSALSLVFFPFVYLGYWLRYRSLRYKLDDTGISMSMGVLFRKEVHLTYRRIQDIHVTRNLFHRKLGLAVVAIQTASGSAGAEMTIEGIRDAEGLRDFLYQHMRGARHESEHDATDPDAAPTDSAPEADEALVLLREIRDAVRELRAQRHGTSNP